MLAEYWFSRSHRVKETTMALSSDLEARTVYIWKWVDKVNGAALHSFMCVCVGGEEEFGLLILICPFCCYGFLQWLVYEDVYGL